MSSVCHVMARRKGVDARMAKPPKADWHIAPHAPSASALPPPPPCASSFAGASLAAALDEPASALDPISTLKIEELINELKSKFTIVIVTHNMQQAVRVSDMTAFYNAEAVEGGNGKVGYLVEFNETERIFNAPQQQVTLDYVSGRFG